MAACLSPARRKVSIQDRTEEVIAVDFKAHARQELGLSRRFIEGVIASLKTPEEWFYQAHPTTNPPLWIVGHLGLADNAFIARFRPAAATKPDGWDERFWGGSKPRNDPSYYPAPEEVVAYLRERRAKLLSVLDELSDEELNAPAPAAGERSPIAGAPSIGHLFLFAALHEALHGGQLTVAHRALGNPPLFG